MNAAEFTGISFVLGILGVGVSFVLMYIKNNSSLCDRISKVEAKVDVLAEKIDKLFKITDELHPRK